MNTAVDPPPPPIVPKRIELLDVDPLELARQLTIAESQLYQKIRPSECMQRSKQSQQTKADARDGVANFIRRSNKVGSYLRWTCYRSSEVSHVDCTMGHFYDSLQG